ncbi:MAG: sigma-70 family RNA polymerase sigma factor [Saprospiraceae bacterium]|nr:sigma-70 family RNA polymerase sigma factor [Saprospiraceae bacterium]
MKKIGQQTDNENLQLLIKGCKKNDRISQQKLYKKYYRYVMYIAFMYTNSEEEAREILNDSFYKVFTKIDTFDDSYPFKPWLRRVTVNTAINHYRKVSKKARHVELTVSHDATTLNEALSSMAYEELVELLNILPPQYKMVFTLYVIEGFKHEEIAEQLDIKVGTSKSNLHRAKQILKKKLDQKGEYNYVQRG